MAKLSMTVPKVKTYDDEKERKAAAAKAAAPSLTGNSYLDDVVGPVFDQIALKKKALDLITDPHTPAGFKASNYLDSMAQSGAMDADTKAAYEAEKQAKAADLKKQSQTAAAIAIRKERELEQYMASDERKQKQPVTTAVKSDSPFGDIGAFIGQSLFNKAKTGSFTGDETEGKLRTEADYFKNLSGQLLDQDTMEKDLAALDSWPQQDKRDLQTLYIHKGNFVAEAAGFPAAGATAADALAARSRLREKYGAETVDHLLESYSRSQNAAVAQEAATAGRENHGLLDTAVSIPLGIVGGVSSALSQGSQALADTLGLTSGRYQTTDPNTPADILSIYTDAVKAGGAEEFGKFAEATAAIHGADENTRKAVGALASTAYQAGISTLDNLAKIALTGGTGTLVLAGTQSFSSAMRAAAANGASPQQAAAMGLVSAASEILTEKLPLDNLLGNLGKATKVSDFGAIVLASLKQAGIEVTTEELNLITGIAAEALILQEKSDYRKNIADMVASGVPYAEARSQANAAILRQAGQTALQSGLSGFMTSAGTSAAAQVAPANRFTEAAQEYDSQKQSATDRLSGLLDGILPQRKQTPAQATPTPAQAREQAVIDLVDEAIATATGAPADPLRAAVDSFRQTGTVTNKQVTDILNNTRAVQKLVQETNLKLDGLTASQKRQNVKAAISAITQTEQVDTVQNTDYDNIITQGGNLYGTEPTAQTYDERGSEAGALGVPGSGQASEADRSGISGTVGEAGERTPEVYLPERQQELTFGKNRYRQEDYYTPERGSALEQTQHSFSNEYGIECRIVKDSAWVEESPAYTDGEKVYIRESIDPATLSTAVPHESTHVMKRNAFHPYLDFADSTPDFLNMDNKTAALRLLDMAAKHRRMDAFNNTDADMRHIYDELNALVYGIQKSGIIQDGQYDFGWVPDAFLDFDGYIQQLDSIHEQYRTQAKTAKTAAPHDSVGAAPAVAKVLTETPKADISKRSLWSWTKEKVLDKGMVFEDLALKTKNRELQAKWNSTRYAQSRAQWLIGNGAENTKSLNAIREEVEKTGKTSQFSEYLYHKHNIDRMQLQSRFEDAQNKPVFGDTITAEVSQSYVEQCEKENPSFTQLAEDVYSYMNHLRQLMVDNGVISQDTANLWAQMYPHYVPISRLGKSGRSIDVPLDTGRTGVNAPVKRATGGSSDILPLFDTIAQRTLQTYTAIARNSFGVELKNTLGSVVEKTAPNVDEAINSVEDQEGLLQKGDNETKPTFTVFENGERVTFEITDEMYDALKPTSQGMAYTNKVVNAISNFHRGLLTEYNPTFMLTNAIKDVQDVILNSQHPAKTYAKIPQAYVELAKKGKWYTEYVANGGEQNTYFNSETNTFETEDKGLKKLLDMPPLGTISKLNSFIEMAPRLAEYIASREAGCSVDVAMLDAARVTTNFAAGGELTKLLNRNGATFLNASVQGAMQQVRNVREAKMNGLKGWVGLAAKFALAGLPAMLLNGLIWKDDEDYKELSDYVKDNYYIIAKYGDGQFVRIPKGRTVAVIQNAFQQVGNAVTGNDEVDMQRFIDLVISNLAPNNPLNNNILSPIIQTANNETWYGEDLVPTRLQDLPAAEQYDESTDAISKWLGEKLNYSPVKINYLLDQYGGGVADTFLPMLTPKAEGGDNSVAGKLLAPLKDRFTADSTMNNQNITDFYDKLDELTTNAKASTATVEDKIIYKYINSVNSELRDLYAEKRKAQSSDLPDDQKYTQVRSIQQKIADAAKKALESCQDPFSADKSTMVAGVISDSLSDLTDCWKNGADTAAAVAAIEEAYDAYTKMGYTERENVKAEGGRAADYLTARASGISTKVFADLYETYYRIDKGDGNASAKASQWSYALEKAQEQGTITSSQKAALKEEMNFWQMIPAETSRFDSLTASGLSADKASYIDDLLDSILPPAGKDNATQQQKIAAVTGDGKLTDKEQQTVLKDVLSESAYDKFLQILKLGYSNDDYANSYRIYSKEKETGGKGTKARTIAAFQKEFGISEAAATALYEIYVPK